MFFFASTQVECSPQVFSASSLKPVVQRCFVQIEALTNSAKVKGKHCQSLLQHHLRVSASAPFNFLISVFLTFPYFFLIEKNKLNMSRYLLFAFTFFFLPLIIHSLQFDKSVDVKNGLSKSSFRTSRTRIKERNGSIQLFTYLTLSHCTFF